MRKEETYRFVEDAFEKGIVETEGTKISDLLPPMSRFSPDGNRQIKKKNVIEKILDFFDKFFVLTNSLLKDDPIEYGQTNEEDNYNLDMVEEDSIDYKLKKD